MENGSEPGNWYRKNDAASKLGKAERTLEKWIADRKLKSRIDWTGRIEVFVPDRMLEEKSRKTDEIDSELRQLVTEALIDKSELIKAKSEILTLSSELHRTQTQMIGLTHERSNYNTALQRASDDREQLKKTRERIEILEAELEKAKTPWWKKLT